MPALRALMAGCHRLAFPFVTTLGFVPTLPLMTLRFVATAFVFVAALRVFVTALRVFATAFDFATVGRADFVVFLARGAVSFASPFVLLAPGPRSRSEVVAERLPRICFFAVRAVRIFCALLVFVIFGPRPADATGAPTIWSAIARLSASLNRSPSVRDSG